ncbi:MAG: glycosyltransferase [Flavobacteriaceae bacterium]|nr:glycosyltransferase [Flavobacteriaceae bacterium]
MQNQLISILIPFKNTSAFIAECLESIINQTYTNWEVVIVDDHSTDNSYSIVESFAKTDSRIQLYKNKGKGIIDALQHAYSKSKGTFITRMDSDDIMVEDKLQTMYDDLMTHGKGHVALGLVKYFSKAGISDGYSKYQSWLNKLTKQGTNYSEIYKECVIASPCWMVYREDFEKCGGFNSDLYPEDYDLVFRFYKQALKCIPSTKLLHYWRDYNYRTSRTQANYSHDMMLELKLHYFLQLHLDKEKTLVIWGAGHKGKYAANYLIKRQVKFKWICDNPKKIGKHIYDQELHDFKHLENFKNPQSIISVANPKAQKEIKAYLNAQNMESMVDYFFFC